MVEDESKIVSFRLTTEEYKELQVLLALWKNS